MVRRIVALAVTSLILAALLGLNLASGVANASSTTLTVVERAETDVVVDLGKSGDSLGDLLAFGNPIYNATNAKKIGRDEGSCIRTNLGVAWECTWTTILPGGSLTVEGPYLDSLHDSVLAITGGTGIYRMARGQMTLHTRNAKGTAFDFVFHIIP